MDDPFWVGGVDATNRVSKIHLENPGGIHKGYPY